MKANKMSARIFSMLLVVVLLLGSALPGASAATGSEGFIRVFHLDVGRKYFTVNQVTELIDAISAVGYTHMELAIGNEGLRLLLDDMSVTANGTTYSSDKVSAGIKAGNKAYSHSGEWAQSEMDAIISHAASRNIEIIPLVNNPGHMSAMLDAAEYVGISSPAYSAKISSGGWWGSTSTKTSSTTVSLSNANAVAFTKALVKKYVDYFAAKGCEYFNLGADEYAADVHSSGSMGFGYMQSNGWYDDFVNYINEVAAIIKAAGMKPVAFNDGIYFNENDDTAFDRDIIIAYWIPSWGTYYVASPAYLVSKGHKILNTNDDWYYVLGKTDGYGYNNAYNGVNNTPVTRVGDGSTMKLSNLTGSMICVWSDDPGVNYESYKSNVLYFIETLAAKNPDYFVVNAHEHTYETVTVDATCTEAGSITTTCTGCGDQTVEVIEALGHAYDCEETAATCGQDGSKVYTCQGCGDTYTEVLTATGEHSYETETVEATCGKDGSVMHTCTVCGDSYSEAISATGNHSYASVKEDATCVAAGSVTYTCTVCGDSYTETIPATGKHIYKSETVNATCVADGYTTHTCAFCSDSYTEAVPATGHNYSCAVTGATCTADGSSVYTCSVCGDSYTEVIPATGHDYAGVITGATCLEGGFTTYTCQGCGDSYVADYTDARGHRYETATVEATCTTDGSVTYYCACGDSYTETIPAAGHNHQAVVTAPTCTAGGYTTHTCAGCGDCYTESLAKTYTKVSAISSGDNYVITLYSGRKYYALSHAGNKLSAVQVTVSDNTITSEITENLVWNYSGNKLSYADGGKTYYLYASASNNWWGNWWGSSSYTLSLSNSNSSTVSFSNSRLKVGSSYLRYSNGSVSLSSSATTTYCFVEK